MNCIHAIKQRIKTHRNGKQTMRLKGKQGTTAKGIQVVYSQTAGDKAEQGIMI